MSASGSFPLKVKSRDAQQCLRRKLKKSDVALFNKYFKASQRNKWRRKATAVRPVLLLKIILREEKHHSTKYF